MFDRKVSDDVRLSVLESLFKDFQKHMRLHMENEEISFKELKSTLKEIIGMINLVQKEQEIAINSVYNKISIDIEKDFVSKLDLHKELTAYRESMIKEILIEKKRTTREFWLMFLAFTTALSACGWIFINVINS